RVNSGVRVRTYSLNAAGMRAALSKAPMEFTAAARRSPAIISLPAPNGEFQRFKVVYSPVMMPGLARKHPDIRTYSAAGNDDPTAVGRFAMTPLGFDALVRGSGTWLMDPYYHLDQSLYASYYLHDTPGSDFSEETSKIDGTKAEAVAGRAKSAIAAGSVL